MRSKFFSGAGLVMRKTHFCGISRRGGGGRGDGDVAVVTHLLRFQVPYGGGEGTDGNVYGRRIKSRGC